MSDTSTATNQSPRRIELPGLPKPEVIAASPHQLARLRYFGATVQEPLTSDEANRLISQLNSDPAFAEKIQAWESEKQALHPDLFRVPPRFAGLSVPAVPPAGPSPYAPISSPEVPGYTPLAYSPPAQPVRSSPKKFLLPAALAILAVLGAAGWFLWKSPWLLQTLHKATLATVSLPLPGSSPAAAPERPAVPAQPLPPGQTRPVPVLPPDELARSVAESQRLAVARYPALGSTDSEINMRFVFRYKRLLNEHSPRLQDPNWPLQLADECAAAAGIKPATSTAGASGTASRSRGKSTSTGNARPIPAPAGS